MKFKSDRNSVFCLIFLLNFIQQTRISNFMLNKKLYQIFEVDFINPKQTNYNLESLENYFVLNNQVNVEVNVGKLKQRPNNTEIIQVQPKKNFFYDENCKEYNYIDECVKCNQGYFLLINRKLNSTYEYKKHRSKCLTKCPNTHAANNINKTCLEYDYMKSLNSTSYINNTSNSSSGIAHPDLVYWYYFTHSSCENTCGEEFDDCSCKYDCVQKGNCCKDYRDICEEYYYDNQATLQQSNQTNNEINSNKIAIKRQNELELSSSSSSSLISNKNKTKSKHCLIEHHKIDQQKDVYKCIRCQKGFYMIKNECFVKCPIKTRPDNVNYICYPRTHCPKKYYYNHLSKSCDLYCAPGFRADKSTMKCKNSQDFSFHWIYPSKGDCSNKCSEKINLDCSCEYECLREGNCCDNYEEKCESDMKKENCGKLCLDCSKEGICINCKENSTEVKGECNCKEGFFYESTPDVCKEIKNFNLTITKHEFKVYDNNIFEYANISLNTFYKNFNESTHLNNFKLSNKENKFKEFSSNSFDNSFNFSLNSNSLKKDVKFENNSFERENNKTEIFALENINITKNNKTFDINYQNNSFANNAIENKNPKFQTNEGTFLDKLIKDMLKLNSTLMNLNETEDFNMTQSKNNITINIIAFNNQPKIVSENKNIINSYNNVTKEEANG